MAHGEAEHGCAQGEPGRPGHEQPASAKHPRRAGLPHPAETAACWGPERGEDDAPAPRQRAAEPALPEPAPSQGCRSDLSGWAGAHRHGAVRPRNRVVRRERPPRRWC
ncbi:hypothetical protein ONA91_06700 [Micromonospora sp. DR5-3]|uniref:hypothetical protein n=1 Tax=unclassified Micromonospora TaxID=2617518 RepID=UPI0011D9B857|nr:MULTISPECIES: hypothetical protein [unclassified Micromonospora]MCW3814144.1 hypothetical protein [Micromonospora sp. DR5-3]TYC25029.1 hypothetical protein FXF52_06875 [Micromonospora sp. MP36]